MFCALRFGIDKVIKLSMVAIPDTDIRLKAIRQAGATDVVFYTMGNRKGKFDKLEAFVARANCFNLTVSVVESGPPIDCIVMGKQGWQEQTKEWIAAIRLFGRLGIKVVCYNFMPQITKDAMVVRTSFDGRTRGDARTSAFRLQDASPAMLEHSETPITLEQMRGNLERFLKAVIPVAEENGVKLAMHPDDPPMSPLGGLQRIMSSVNDFDWLLELFDSPANGITFCIGCFAGFGYDVAELISKYKNRIHFVHLRNIKGSSCDFVETFPDDGDIDLPAVIKTLQDSGFEGCIRPDHAPAFAGEVVELDGYGFQGHLFTLGYMRGLLQAGAKITRGI